MAARSAVSFLFSQLGVFKTVLVEPSKSHHGADQKPLLLGPSPSRWHCRHNVRTRRVANNFLGSGDLGDEEDGRKEEGDSIRSGDDREEKRPPPHRRWQSLTAVVCAHLPLQTKYEWGKGCDIRKVSSSEVALLSSMF